MLSVVLHFAILLLFILFRLASALRLTIPLLYALVVPTLFSDWYHSHEALAEGLWWALVGLLLLPWAAPSCGDWASTGVARPKSRRCCVGSMRQDTAVKLST